MLLAKAPQNNASPNTQPISYAKNWVSGASYILSKHFLLGIDAPDANAVLTKAFEDTLDGTVGFAGRGLLVPTMP